MQRRPTSLRERILWEDGHGGVLQALWKRQVCQERAVRGKQRYLCKACGLAFTDTPARGKPLAMKAAAVLLYVSGLSMNRTAKLLGVSTPTIQAWLEQFAAAYAQKPEPEGRAVVIELDEMWHYVKRSQSRSGSGKLGIKTATVTVAPEEIEAVTNTKCRQCFSKS